MKLNFRVENIPPKKDGANSMWNKKSELIHLKELRKKAFEAMNGKSPFDCPLHLKIIINANQKDGDLDNFISGICDGLMAAHPRTPITNELWNDLPEGARPRNNIVYQDDSLISKIEAERKEVNKSLRFYDVQIKLVEN